MNRNAACILALGLLAGAGCSREDDARARQKLDNAKQELRHDLDQAGTKIKKSGHEAAVELRKDAHEASKEIKKGSDDLRDKARHPE